MVRIFSQNNLDLVVSVGNSRDCLLVAVVVEVVQDRRVPTKKQMFKEAGSCLVTHLAGLTVFGAGKT